MRTMWAIDEQDRILLEAVSELVYCNPFLPRRVALERRALDHEFEPGERTWSLDVMDPQRPRINGWKIFRRAETLVERLRTRLTPRTAPRLRECYRDGVLYTLYYRYTSHFAEADGRRANTGGTRTTPVPFFRDFLRDWEHFFAPHGSEEGDPERATHYFSFLYQIHRAFRSILESIIGSSQTAARLRAAAWESIFTHDMRRYRDYLHARMSDFATLITGPSGTGKELVARAVAGSSYLAFDPERCCFPATPEQLFLPINLAALPATLVESELFGHRRGAFTGAVEHRQGRLEQCLPQGSVFLDEIGELTGEVQVKLLRVIESRVFQPLGSTENRIFRGKVIAATNRNLPALVDQGTFRADLYFRLCSDQIVVPSLLEHLSESPDVLDELVLFLARRIVGPAVAPRLAAEATEWIRKHLPDYSWPGNFRELDQCVRNVLIRREYRPLKPSPGEVGPAVGISAAELTAEELLNAYCLQVYRQCGSYTAAARRLGLDRRTVKARVAVAGKTRGGKSDQAIFPRAGPRGPARGSEG